MINKEQKIKLLNYYDKKEDKIFVSYLIDKVNKFDLNNKLNYTYFLDLNEKEIAIFILKKIDIEFYLFNPLEDTSRFVIFFIPKYMTYNDVTNVIAKYIAVIKISPILKAKLLHKDYMGGIYSLGLKENVIGDIFVLNNICYLFCFEKNKEYILNNLTKVSKYDVNSEVLEIFSNEVKNIKVKYKTIEVIVSSLRIDTVLSEVFLLSRNEVKQKIQNGDLYINCKEMFFVAYLVKNKDIVSFKKCGKIKIGEVLRNTKSGKFVLIIYKYN